MSGKLTTLLDVSADPPDAVCVSTPQKKNYCISSVTEAAAAVKPSSTFSSVCHLIKVRQSQQWQQL